MGKLQRFQESTTASIADGSCVRLELTKELQEKYSPSIARLSENASRLTEETKKVNRLLEDIKGSHPDVYLKLVEAGALTRLTEAAKPNLYRFRIGRVNENKPNHNGRKYKRKLWENVINKQQDAWKGRVGLADHPPEDSDGEFKNSAIVWHDMEIDGNHTGDEPVWGVGSFVGPYGRLAQEIVDVDGKIGFSTSGFGELEYDGSTVNADTFQLERSADIVLNPSQEVFGTSSDALNIEYDGNKPVEGANKTEFEYAEGTRTNYTATNAQQGRSSVIKENRMDRTESPRPVSPLEEKRFRRDIQKFLEDASKMDNPQARLTELTEVLALFEEGVAPDLRESVEAKILEDKKALENLIQEAQHTQEAFGTDSEGLKIGVALLAEEVKVAAAEARDWEKIALALKENNGKFRTALEEANAALNTRPTAKFVGELKARIEFLETQRKRQLNAFNEETEETEKELEEATKVGIEKDEKIKVLESKLAAQMASLQEASKATPALEAQKKAYAALKEAAEKAAVEGGAIIAEQDTTIKTLEAMVERLQNANKTLIAEKATVQDEFEAYKEEAERAPTMMPRFEERVSGHLNFKENGGLAVEKYWQDLVTRFGEQILPYERQIRSQKTYKEASTAFLRAFNEFDADGQAASRAHLPESTSLGLKERQTMLEGEGMAFGQHRDIVDRKPGGWV